VNFFAQIRFAGKHFPEKLFTFSHNSQNCNPFDTPPAFAAGNGVEVSDLRPCAETSILL
jgi:hypothetical protein